MLHHYLQRGIKPEDVINLSLTEKMFYKASLEAWLDEEERKYRALAGG
jgi:hypothetical protein